jgi:hypothetical protein
MVTGANETTSPARRGIRANEAVGDLTTQSD